MRRKKEQNLEVEENNTTTLKIICKCDLCENPIYTSARSIKLNALTGRAYWDRLTSVENMHLCDNCSKELNDIIDRWIIDKNKKLMKFKIDKEN